MKDSKLRLSHLCSVTAALFVPLLQCPRQAQAHNLQAHQGFTEVAYAYLKALQQCKPELTEAKVNLAECFSQCKDQFLETALEGGWTSSCYAGLCSGSSSNALNLKICDSTMSGSEMYSCVDRCVSYDNRREDEHDNRIPPVCNDGPSFLPKMVTRGGSSGALTYQLTGKPAWLPSDDESDLNIIADEFCRASCYLTKYHFANGDGDCNALASVLAYGDIDTQKATNAVNYLRDSVDGLCPNPGEIDFRFPKEETKKFCQEGDGPTVRKLRDRTKAVRVYGHDVDKNGEWYEKVTSDGTLQNVPDLLSLAVEFKNGDRGSTPDKDVTGTVLGMNALMTDRLNDTNGRWKFFPMVEDGAKLAAEYLLLWGYSSVAPLVFAAYAWGCLISITDIGDCFGSLWDDLLGSLEWLKEAEKKIENYSLLSKDLQPNFSDWDLTSLYHFMRDGVSASRCHDDDICGLNISQAFAQGAGELVGAAITGANLTPFGADFRLSYDASRKTIENYTIRNADDGLGDSDGTWKNNAWYYERVSITELDFRPIDNQAYYWWHKWHFARGQARDAKGRQLYGLFPLGIVLHTIQDMTLYFHATSVLWPGHAPEEGRINDGFRVQRMVLPPDVPPENGSDRFAIGEKGYGGQWDFFRAVAGYIHEMVGLKVDGLLHPRKLAHFVQKTLIEAKVCDYSALDSARNGGYHCTDEGVRRVVIPLAVAATAMLIVEATRPESDPVEVAYIAKSTPLSKFEKVPTTETPTANNTILAAEISGAGASPDAGATWLPGPNPLDPDDSFDFVFAGNQPTVQNELLAFFRGERQMGPVLSLILKEQARGRAQRSGMNLDEASLEKVAKAEVDKLKAMGQFFKDGNLPRLQQGKACADLSVATINQASTYEVAELQAVCNGTKDSDGDGVPDLNDQCITAPSLLTGCGTVGADGCIFQNTAAANMSRIAPNLNAMLVSNPAYVPPDAGATP